MPISFKFIFQRNQETKGFEVVFCFSNPFLKNKINESQTMLAFDYLFKRNKIRNI